jgi:hypothetical protein
VEGERSPKPPVVPIVLIQVPIQADGVHYRVEPEDSTLTISRISVADASFVDLPSEITCTVILDPEQ